MKPQSEHRQRHSLYGTIAPLLTLAIGFGFIVVNAGVDFTVQDGQLVVTWDAQQSPKAQNSPETAPVQ